ncbi:DUF4440 domain-containing protein [Clostridium sp. SM-530-WT-3G]|uniref:nuclear transport factor 2 family protein n=1 Tax=Clostridium sp. SM-530-WT-3G TaxID=2725303 RepID=UPI00145C5320|nr:DUF4440 domain-containing protein [Clostridium sp. SM-530-WT-3G]NME83944.1 DUF4440 domain-containing protein [Clostridium sp. SM-530-WT-3G]
MNRLEKEILNLENNLLLSSIRKCPEKICDILDENFVEYTSSGQEYHYKKGDTFQNKEDENELNWTISDFKIKQLSEGCILATYKVIKNDETNESKKYTLRSSIWKYIDNKWKMVFHQGTLCGKFK